jgi:uncharacterized protein YjaZ
MKIPEVKINEVFLLLFALDTLAENIAKDFDRLSKKIKRRMLFRPWEKSVLAIELIRAGQGSLKTLADMQQLRQTLMESTGLDEDTQPVSLKDMIEKRSEAIMQQLKNSYGG